MTRALVISGGGSKGAFAVGAIQRLREAGITWDLVVGTSTGALIAPLITTDDIATLVQLYSTVTTEQILTPRGPIDIFTHDSLYDTTPLWHLIQDTITPEKYQQIVASPIAAYLTTVNLQTGTTVYWTQHQSGPVGDPQTTATPLDRPTFLRAMLASANQPVLMPLVEIRFDHQQYGDGGLHEVTPLKLPIELGATIIEAIVLSPAQDSPVTHVYTSIFATLARVISLLVDNATVMDIQRATLINQAIDYRNALLATATSLLTPTQRTTLFDNPAHPDPFAPYALLTLHMIRPPQPLPTDGLTFDPPVLQQMIQMGRQAAEQAMTTW